MIDYQTLLQRLTEEGMSAWAAVLPDQIQSGLDATGNSDIPKWRTALEQLPAVQPSVIELDSAAVTIGRHEDLDESSSELLNDLLMQLHPWRKGPFDLFGIYIDTEWRSDWKWDRLKDHIKPLQGRKVLDVGCGNGYHCWRMAGAGADLVVGVDPMPRFIFQYQVIRHFLLNHTNMLDKVFVLPIGIDDVPQDLQSFDTVFSMGVLYHRRSPLEHILKLRDCLVDGGELVLETLVIEGDENDVLFPKGRYAQMNNVWFIPNPQQLQRWVKRCGFDKVRLIDVTKTSFGEQRSTDWMRFHSLAEFLDPDDSGKTIEGYPAPRRAIVLAEKA